MEIVNELNRIPKVTVKIGAMAASAATYIAASFYTIATPSSMIMIHRPKIYTGGDEKQIENDVKLLKSITDDYRLKYAQKTGLTTDQIEELWKDGDKWFTAPEALKHGFIDAVENINDPAKEQQTQNQQQPESDPVEAQYYSGRATWTLEDYLDKDPVALERMEKDNPALFKQLNSEYFKGG